MVPTTSAARTSSSGCGSSHPASVERIPLSPSGRIHPCPFSNLHNRDRTRSCGRTGRASELSHSSEQHVRELLHVETNILIFLH